MELPPIFSDHMVLQRDFNAPVWGLAAPGEEVMVKVAGQEKKATADKDGRWAVRLDPAQAGGPHELLVAGKDSQIKLADVLFGDVWFVAGQSNPGMGLGACEGGPEAAAEAGKHPLIRLNGSDKGWAVPDEPTAKAFGAVAYWFGLGVQQATDVPVGLINRAWGGRAARVFIRPEALAADEVLNREVWQPFQRYAANYEQLKKAWDAAPKDRRAGALAPPTGSRSWPGDFWQEVMTGPVPFGVKGVIWYQGESDAWGFTAAEAYRHTMEVLIADWRKQWDRPDLPFLVVQLPAWEAKPEPEVIPEPSPWCFVQETQAALAKDLPAVFVAGRPDDGENDIHPRRKKPLCDRLVKAALAGVYGQNVLGSGPTYKEMKVEGARVRLVFDHVGGGLVAKDGKLAGFALAGEDRMFFRAEAVIDGESVVLSSAQVPKPAAARYLFYDATPATLFNKEGLPALPFRTDDWSWDIPAREQKTVSTKSGSAAEGFTRVYTYRPAQPTVAKVACDKDNLRVTFECRGAPDPAAPDRWNDGFWKHDYVEFLIDSKADRRNYLRFAVNPKGAFYSAKGFNDAEGDTDLLCQDWLGGKRWIDNTWKPEYLVQAKTQPDGWTVELVISWKGMDVPAPAAGTKMGVQFMRYHAATDEYSEWATTGRDHNTGAMMPAAAMGGFTMFHAPSRFGILTIEP